MLRRAAGVLVVAVVFLLLSFTDAQSAAPLPVTAVDYTTVNATLYLQGGSLNIAGTNLTQQFYSLDLSKPWNDRSPLWKALPVSTATHSSPEIWQQSLTVTADGSNLVVWDATHYAITTYDFGTGLWTNQLALPTTNFNWAGLKALVDPTSAGTGIVYVPK